MTSSHLAPFVVVGPMLRHVDRTTATVWLETDRACEVEVLGHRERTWEVHGHHYAIVVVEGLEPGTSTPYEVRLDGALAWPEPGSPLPPCAIRTLPQSGPLRLAFGSCRRAAPFDRASLRKVGADALVALAEQMMADDERWPDALFLAGDQVYADEPSPATARRLRHLHGMGHHRYENADGSVLEEIVDFQEYTWLYHESWRVPAVRWLLSCLPTAMVLDDHDLRDDWNTSLSWREEASQQPWFRARVQGALASYWVYQHLGNLSPAELADDPLYAAVREAPTPAAREQLLADFAWRADQDPRTVRWSFHRDLGRTRLVVVDSRCARRLDPQDRALVDDPTWAWLEQVTDVEVDHLLIGTSLPVLLLHGVHHLEGWDEAVSEGAWGPLGRRVGERVRQAADLEHWAAFRQSFEAMVALVRRVAGRADAPASVLWLSGDVHCSYLARAKVDGVDSRRTAVHQLTMSPFRNPLQRWVQQVNTWFERRPLRRALAWLARSAGVVDPGIAWEVHHGPWYANGVMTLVLDGRTARVEVDHARAVRGAELTAQVLQRTATVELTG